MCYSSVVLPPFHFIFPHSLGETLARCGGSPHQWHSAPESPGSRDAKVSKSKSALLPLGGRRCHGGLHPQAVLSAPAAGGCSKQKAGDHFVNPASWPAEILRVAVRLYLKLTATLRDRCLPNPSERLYLSRSQTYNSELSSPLLPRSLFGPAFALFCSSQDPLWSPHLPAIRLTSHPSFLTDYFNPSAPPSPGRHHLFINIDYIRR